MDKTTETQELFEVDKTHKSSIIKIGTLIRGCTGFDREPEVGEAIRSHASNANLNINAEDNLAYAA